MAQSVAVDRPIPPEAEPADPDMTVMSLVEEMRAVRREDAEFYRRAELQEQIVLGEVLTDENPEVADSVVPLYQRPDEMHENVMLPAVETLVARVAQGRIESKAWPRTPHVHRIAAAEAANLFLDYERAREKRDQKVHECLFYSLIHGRSGVYTTWDESAGPFEALEPELGPDGFPLFNPDGSPRQRLVEDYGAIRTEVLSCFEFWDSGEDDFNHTRWQVRKRLVDKWSAKRALKAVGIERDPQEQTPADYGLAARTKHVRGVEVLEVWVRPGPMIAKGMFALVVDNCVVSATPYPYRHGRLPIQTLIPMRVRGTSNGHTKVKDAIFQQKLVDTSLRTILRRADIAASCYLVGSNEIIDNLDESGDGRVRYNGVNAVGQAVAWVNGADIPQDVVGVYNLARAGVNDVLGVSEESITGGDQTSVSSGEQLKTAAALDSQKTVPLRRRVEEVWQEADRQKLDIVKEKMRHARLISVMGDPVRAGYFKGADFEGVDVSIEGASGLAESHLGRARSAEERAAAGQLAPQDGAEMSQTGQTETVMGAEARQRVQKQGLDALRGMAVTPDPSIPAAGAVRELRSLVAQVPDGNTAGVLRLIAEYQRLAAMPPPGAGPEAPGAPQPKKPGLTTSTKQAIQSMEPIQ